MIKIHAGVLHIQLTGTSSSKQAHPSPCSVLTDKDYESIQSGRAEEMCFQSIRLAVCPP